MSVPYLWKPLASVFLMVSLAGCGQFTPIDVCKDCRVVYGQILERDQSGQHPVEAADVSIWLIKQDLPLWARILTGNYYKIAGGTTEKNGSFGFAFKDLDNLQNKHILLEVKRDGQHIEKEFVIADTERNMDLTMVISKR